MTRGRRCLGMAVWPDLVVSGAHDTLAAPDWSDAIPAGYGWIYA